MSLIAQPLTFAVVPQQSASRLAIQWNPIIQKMRQFVGQDIIFATAPDIPTFESRLKSGAYSFAYMNPYHFVVFHENPGYQALARAKDKQIKGIIVVRKDSGITRPEQLSGQTLAFPSPAAFAASILPRAYLTKNQIHFTAKYVSSHDSVYLSVAKGLYPAGGGVMRTFNAIRADIRNQLTPVWTTKGYTPHAIAVHPDVDPKIAKQVQFYLIELAKTETGKKLLNPLKIKGFVAAQNQDWDDVRSLNIDLLSTR
jgi:phosphonate transport system substrate-binding protein